MKRVLLVDDAPDIRTIARICLELDGIEVQVAENGAKGLERVEQAAPDLIVLDVMMPVLDGPSTLKRLRESGFTGPVVFLTASIQRHEVQSYLDLGADAVLPKPFDPIDLPRQLREVFHRVQGPDAG